MINFKLVSENADWIRENYKFDFRENVHVDPEYRKVRDPYGNYIDSQIDDMYDGFSSLYEGDDGMMYACTRYYGMGCEELAKVVSTSVDVCPSCPIVIWKRMVKRDA